VKVIECFLELLFGLGYEDHLRICKILPTYNTELPLVLIDRYHVMKCALSTRSLNDLSKEGIISYVALL
jgi:hypothetical protein